MRTYLPRILVALMVIAVFSGVFGASVAQDPPSNVCTTNIEMLNGQSRFSLTGLSRFSLTGLEGANATFEEGDLSPELKALYEEVIANPVDSNWMWQYITPIVNGEVVLPGSPLKTIIFIVDDFPDRLVPTAGLPSEWIEQINTYYGSVPTNIKVLTHGFMVQRVAEELLERLNGSANTDLQDLYNNIVVFPVDISIGGTYRLEVLTDRLKTAVSQAMGVGYNRFVINMSIGLLPCELPASPNFPPFDYSDFLSARNEASVDYYRFDVDAYVRFEGRQSGLEEPAVYNGYGLTDYLIERYYSEYPPAEQEEKALEHLQYLLSFGASAGQTDLPLPLPPSRDPALDDLREYLRTTLEISAQNGDFALIPVAASGNYADILPNAPLQPASFPEVVAVGAQLGMLPTSPEWMYSQPAHLIAPGAWYELYEADSYVAGTSFAAPFASVIASMFVAYPDACYFGTGQPPLMSFDYLETALYYGSNPFNCSYDGSQGATPTPEATSTPVIPTETPAPGSDLIVNGGFENEDASQNPDLTPWVGKGLLGDKIRCNKDKDGDGVPDKIIARSGDCAFVFKGSVGEKSGIQQNIDLALVSINTGDSLHLSAFVNGGSSGAGRLKVRVKYSDAQTSKLNVDLLPNGAYEELTGIVEIVSLNITKVKVQIQNTSQAGKVAVDDVRLFYVPVGSGWLPIP
jgi:hypothetical protein